ncbi:hypothetical protein C8R43DRAFT_550704 [Mycena crocata]|nr:hypothetical protein C8R43DRAFT_550704 [Mycena crocata]
MVSSNSSIQQIHPSPYPELLRSNTVPLDFQIPVIAGAIRTSREDLKATENTAGDSETRLLALQDFVQIHRSMVSAMRRLPSEILSEIFTYCVGQQDGCRPRVVSAICSRWREVVLSTPRLWCDIYLREEEIRLPSLHSLLSLQLERSAQVPLSIVFSYLHDDISILELLLTASDRWQSLDLDLTTDQHEHVRGSSNHFPLLRKLVVRITPSFDLGNLSRPLPLLEDLTLSWPPCPIPSKFPWTGLLNCTLFHCSSSEALSVLHSSARMEEFSLYNCYCPSQRDSSHLTAITSTIRSLTISHCSGPFNQGFLGALTAPKLQELIIDDFQDNSINTHIVSLLTGSAGPVTHLSFCGVRLSESELISLLQFADTVDHLEISWPWDVHSNDFMRALTLLPGNRQQQLLPRLRLLNITGGLSCRDDNLLMMLESRSPGLERVELYYAGRAFFFDRFLDGLRKEGMNIDMRLDGPLDPFSELGYGALFEANPI